MATSKQEIFKAEQAKAIASAEGAAIRAQFQAIKASAKAEMEAELAAGVSKHQASSKYENTVDRASGERDNAINAIAHKATESIYYGK